MNGRERDINSLIYLPARLCHPPRGGALLGLCQLSSPPAETYNGRLATLIPQLALSAWIKPTWRSVMGIVGSGAAFYLFILFYRNYVCGRILGKKCNQRDRSLRGIIHRIKHWTNTARSRAVVSPLLRRMCVCFEKDGAHVCMRLQEVLVMQAGCAGSVWLGWAAS